MLDVIRLLPDSLANQIAAGEVVQRPASIVKELLENAVDAQAQHIKLLVRDAGKTLVQVIDDGIGMSATDARLSFERHATSKIHSTDDLFNIRTMGFRGEALASIAAVAQVEMRTRRPTDDIGTEILIEGSQLKYQQANACVVGTSIAVKNLFFNVPARRNFLKSNPVEMRHILDEFQRVALAHPSIEFSLYHNDTEVYQLSSGKLSQRIVAIFGKHYQKQLAPCQENTPLVQIQGYIGKPENAKKTRGEQFLFVNQRFIRHPYLHHAILTAYEGLIAAEHHPFYVLYLDIAPIHIDINIHPTKTEVKFDDERAVYAIVQATVRRALSLHNFAPALDFETDVNFDARQYSRQSISENLLYPGTGSSQKSSNAPQDTLKSGGMPRLSASERHNLDNWQRLFEGLSTKATEQQEGDRQGQIFDSQANKSDIALPQQAHHRHILVVQQQYLVSSVRSGLMLVHIERALERIWFHRLEQQRGKSAPSIQQLLFPRVVSLSAADFVLFADISREIAALGFVFEVLPEQKIRLTAIPAELSADDESNILHNLLSQYQHFADELRLGTRTAPIARALARQQMKQLNSQLSAEMRASLIDKLFATDNPQHTPTGKPIMVVVEMAQIQAFFGE